MAIVAYVELIDLIGLLQVELIGRMQRQPAPADNRFYTCIDYVKLVGAPLYGFEPCDGLLALAPSQAGMTANASEGSWKAERRRPGTVQPYFQAA